jgi:GNAT superfamily N-acetyltransferase
MDRDEAIELQRRGLEAFFRVLPRAAESSRLAEYPGVIASVVPSSPARSFPNSVVYESAEDLAAALEPLAASYRHAGVGAWTVWVPEDERPAARLLEAAGHRLDARPAAMVLELRDLPAPEPDGLDWDGEATPGEVGRLNDLAYGFGDHAFTRAFQRLPDESLRLYRARVDGELGCVAGTLDRDDDCVLVMVATDPRRRGGGLARRLCHAALLEARDRGLRTSSLQATSLGRPVYERLGYRMFGAIEMWERRGASASR